MPWDTRSPLTRDRDGFFAHLEGGRSVLTVALASEIEVMRSHFGLIVTPVDQVEGFVLTKGKQQTLQLAVVRQGDSSRPMLRRQPPNARSGRTRADARKVTEAGGSWFRGETGRRTGDAPRAPSRRGFPGRRPGAGSPGASPSRSRGFEQDARLGEHDLAGTVDVVADHGAAHQERLGQDPRQPLAQAGVDDGVDGTEQFGNAVGRHQAR